MVIRLEKIKINIIILGIVAAILMRYTPTNKMYYLYMLILTILLGLKTITYHNLEINKSNLHRMIFIITSMLYIYFLSIDNMVFVTKRYLIIFILMLYLYLSFSKYGIKYAEKFYKQLTIILNVFSVVNLYQIIFQKPFLLKYMDLMEVGYNYKFGTSGYRTMSVFNHPIVSGLFFIIAFLCNMYIVKNKNLKYVLQILLILNIYTSKARSAWITFAIIIFILIFNNRKKILIKISKPKLTYRKVIIAIVFLIFGFLFAIFYLPDIFSSIIERFGDSLKVNSTSGSNLQRTMTIKLILNHMFNGDPIRLIFGYGGGTVSDFMILNPVLLEGFTTTDNQYLSLFYEFGLVGVIFYITLFLNITKKYLLNKSKHWTITLSYMCFIAINVDLIFFEAWPVILIMMSFLISILTFKFKNNYVEKNKQLITITH